MKKNKERRVRKYSSGLKSAPTIEPNEYYKSDRDKRLHYVQPEEVKIDGVTFGYTKDLLFDKMRELTDAKDEIKGVSQTLTSILIEYGYNTSNIDLNALVQDIYKLNIIHPDKEYVGYKIVDEYVVGYGYDLIQVKGEEPEDFDKGYWTIIDGEWKLDNVKYQQIWGG